MRKPVIELNLAECSFLQALDYARATSGKTYEEIAEYMGLGKETIHQYFTNPNYSPAPWRLPKLCAVLGNTIILQWLCINAGGHYIEHVQGNCYHSDIRRQIAALTKEFSDVLREDAAAGMDYDFEEAKTLEREILHLIKSAEEAHQVIKQLKNKLVQGGKK